MEDSSASKFIFERVALSYQHGELSPGSIFGNRITIGADEERDLFWASGTHLHRLSLSPSPPASEFVPNYSGKMLLPPPAERGGRSVLLESKNGVNHASEIQNLAIVTSGSSQSVYSVDATGRVLVNRLEGEEHKSTHVLDPKRPINDIGWVGVSAHSKLPSLTVTARYWDKLVTVYDEDRVVSQFKTLGHPTQMQLLDNGMLAMTEQGSYSIWDLRLPFSTQSKFDGLSKYQLAGVGSSGACVQRVYVSTSPLYAMDIMGTKIAVAGAERSCVVFDMRGEGADARWNNCLKYDVTRLRLSRSNPELVYVSGLDNELLVGRWDGTIGLSHFDGPHIESHWIGISNNNPTDTVYGLAQSGHMYICKNVPSLLDGVSSANRRNQTSSPRPSTDESGAPTVMPHQRQSKKKKNVHVPATKKQKTEETPEQQ